MTQSGQSESSPVFPWKLRFVANHNNDTIASKAAGYVNYLDELEKIPSGNTLYDVYATDKPTELGGTEKKIAQIITKSQMTKSNWGDEHLYFRHQRMDDDLAIHPEWTQYTPKYGGFFMLDQEGEEVNSACPFANLLGYLQ